MVALGTVRDWAVFAQRVAAAVDSEPDEAPPRVWSFAILRQLWSAGSLLQLAGWAAFYTVALILITASVTAERTSGKSFQINFEYKVF